MRIPAPIARKPLFTGLSVAAVALIAGLITWAVWPEPAPAPKPRERAYKATTACLLTDDRGIVGDPARAAWAGMQEASLATRIKVQYLAITGPQTEANGLSYYNSLGLRKCTVIIAAGPVPVATAMAGAARFPDIEHVTVGAAPAGPASSG
ncbi:MAG: hypothetical protein HKP61_02980, partial [Dactylosporangium sp.]|nr:hypothetical protein [Dactylosporangium sp.]NNJ59920.1 hypothetical protein [Dactylosporangium sp.]